MFKRFVFMTLTACMLLPGLARGQEVVDVLPSNAFGYVIINHIGDTDGKLQSLGQRMKLPIPSVVDLVKNQSGINKGVDLTGAIGAAILPTERGPSAIIFVPVTEYSTLLEQLNAEPAGDDLSSANLMGQQVFVGSVQGHAALGRPSDRAILSAIVSGDTELGGVSDSIKATVNEHDAALVITPTGVKVLTAFGQNGLNQIKEVMRERVEEDNPMLAGIEVYVHLLNAIDAEVNSAVIGLKLDDDGSLKIAEQAFVNPDGELAPIIKEMKPREEDLLAHLPDIPYVLVFGGEIPRAAIEPMMNFSGEMMKSMQQMYGMTPKQVDEMMALSIKYFKDIRSMSFLLGVGQDDAPLYSEMLAVVQVDDSETYMTNYRKFLEHMNEIVGEAEGSFFSGIESEDIEVDGQTVIKVAMPMPGLQQIGVPDVENFKVMMEKLYGTDGITVFIAPADKTTVVISYTDTALLSKVLQAVKNEDSAWLSQEPHLVSTSKRLPSDARALGYWSLDGTKAFVERVITMVAGEEKDFEIPDFPAAPPVGWTMTVSPDAIRFDTVVPAEAIEAIGLFVQEVQQMNAE